MFVLLAACGDKASDAPLAGPAQETLPGVWAGVYPCANCPGIDVTLWLRADTRFFIEQRYRRADGETTVPAAAYGFGRWEWRADEQLLVLTGAGPVRRFERPGQEALLMRTASPEEHRLRRRPGTTDFGAVIRVQGTARPQGDGFAFHECLTGYEVALATSGDYTRFSRQFRRVVPRGEMAPVEFEGRYAWAADGAPAEFRIERFVTVRQSGGC